MARRYQIDELLWLRSSPLVTKPASLPPVEEWMGPLPERKPKDFNGQNETTTTATTTTSRQPNLFETRHIPRGSHSEDIILGPPRTAFASASRMAGSRGSIDATERPSRFPDSDEVKNDRFNNFREKFFKDREPGDRDFDRRDGKLGTFANRRGDKEDWASGRPRRTFGPEDPERKPKRNGDFDRWEGRDNPRDKDPRESVFERNRDKDGRIFPRKDGQPGRSRLEGSWFRDGNTQDALEEEDKPPARNREWRRDKHGVDRDWTRGAKFEHEPEWLESNTVHTEQQRPAHTQEDFERWKERMKAGTAQAQATEKKENQQEPASSGVTQRAEARPTDGEIFSSSGAPFQQSATMEKFFGLLNETTQTPEPVNQSPVEPPSSKKESAPAKSIKSSRFAGLFSPPPGTPTAKDPEHETRDMSPAGNHPPSSTDADQEGFQRILQMLGSGGGSRNATPHNEASQLHRPQSFVQAEQGQSTISSPARDQINRPEQMPFRDSPARTAPPGLQDNLIQESFRDPQAREREHLLRLMQQVRISPGPNQLPGSQGPHSAGPVPPPPGLVGMPDMLPHPPGIPQKAPPNFLEDPAIANMQRPDAEQLRRRSNGPPPPPPPPPMGYFDDIPFPQGNNMPITPGGSRAPAGQGQHPVMGIQRPPGFEHIPPPGFPAQQLPPQQGGAGPNPMAPPPGIPTPRGMNPNFVSNMMPMPGGVPPFNERQGFPRGAGGNGAAAFGPPPGMMPPPGYMNLNGPPPGGMPPMPPNAEALMGLGHGGQGPFPGNPGSQGPPPSSRHLLDMFGQTGGGGEPRGGMMNPGQFR